MGSEPIWYCMFLIDSPFEKTDLIRLVLKVSLKVE